MHCTDYKYVWTESPCAATLTPAYMIYLIIVIIIIGMKDSDVLHNFKKYTSTYINLLYKLKKTMF